jgi:thiol:disulfide interchange protein DsbD
LITILLVVIALNLFGVFELLLPGAAANKAAELAGREGVSGAFFNGVLAVVLGASCVAPLMAAAIGWAISQPPLVILLVFTALGLGLALPYLVMAFVPAARALLPKPGAWMEKFKTVMGFPMLATAAWTFSLAVDHYGGAGVLWLGLALVLFALAAWIFGEFIQRGARRKGLAAALALSCVAAGYGFALEHKLDWRNPDHRGRAAAGIPAGDGEGIAWQPWSAEAVAAARAAGRPVFVDFTAKWCLTCKANLASSIEIEPVRRKLREINAVALMGDFTLKDPAIAAELKRFGRAGVPLVLVYPRDASQPPEVLPTLLTPGIVLAALERAAR